MVLPNEPKPVVPGQRSMRPRSDAPPVVPVRHYGRWAATVVIAVLAVMLLQSIITNPRFEWDVVTEYLFSERILQGLVLTLKLTVIAMVIGITLGIVLAILRLSPNPLLSSMASFYLWFFRGIPELVLLLFVFNLAALYPELTVAIPFGPDLFAVDSNAYITAFTAAILGLGLKEAAYMAEIVRAGLISVGKGQTEAAQAVGMSSLLTLRRIILPQAMRAIIPTTGNEVISMLKGTSLVSVIAVADLLYSAQLIYAVNYKTIPLLLVATIWYLAFTSILTVIQYYIERRFARGSSQALPLTPIQKLKRQLRLREAT